MYITDTDLRNQLEIALRAAGANIMSAASAKMQVCFVAGPGPFTSKLHKYIGNGSRQNSVRVYHADAVDLKQSTVKEGGRVSVREIAAPEEKKTKTKAVSPKLTTEQRAKFTQQLIGLAASGPDWSSPLQKSPGLGTVHSPLCDSGSVYADVYSHSITPDGFVQLAALLSRSDECCSLAQQMSMKILRRASTLRNIKLSTHRAFSGKVAGSAPQTALPAHFEELWGVIAKRGTVFQQTLLLLLHDLDGPEGVASAPVDSDSNESSEESDLGISPPDHQSEESSPEAPSEIEDDEEDQPAIQSVEDLEEILNSKHDLVVFDEFLASSDSDRENATDSLFDPFSLLGNYTTAAAPTAPTTPTTTTTTSTTTATTATGNVADSILAGVLQETWIGNSSLKGKLLFLQNSHSARRLVLHSFVFCFFRALVGVFWACPLKTSNPKHQSELMASAQHIFRTSTDLKDCLLVCLSNIQDAPATRHFYGLLNTLAQSILEATNRAFCSKIAECRERLL
jgi:hypothetical protein